MSKSVNHKGKYSHRGAEKAKVENRKKHWKKG
jgi:hypothetical protein